MTDKCLNVKSQFRYLDNELLQNVAGGTFVSSTNKNSKTDRLLVSSRTFGQIFNDQRLKQTAAGSLYFYNVSVCAEPSKTSYYVDRKTYCDKPEQIFTFGKCNIYSISQIKLNTRNFGQDCFRFLNKLPCNFNMLLLILL